MVEQFTPLPKGLIWLKDSTYTLGKITGLVIFALLSRIKYNTKLKASAYLLIAILCVSILMIIEHLPFASLLYIFSTLGIAVVYTIYFFRKISKSLLDYCKWIWVLTAIAAVQFKMEHLPGQTILAAIEHHGFIIIVLLATIREPNNKID